jgi:hypothetical protein
MLRVIIATKALSVAAGLFAAFLWWSASGAPPLAPGAVLDGTTANDPFNAALHQSATLNQRAAKATAVSVLLMASPKRSSLSAVENRRYRNQSRMICG